MAKSLPPTVVFWLTMQMVALVLAPLFQVE